MSIEQSRGDTGLGWVTLADGVQYSRAWLTTNAPGLFAAWDRAQNPQERQRLVHEIQQAAAIAESSCERDPRNDNSAVTVQWTETSRYEAEIFIERTSTEDAIWNEIATLPDPNRRTLEVTDDDNTIISVLDSDGVAVGIERSVSASSTVDWADLADSIDERLAESPGWPALSECLDRARSAGYDIAANLPRLAAQETLPGHDPAVELQYRLISACPAAIPTHTRVSSTGDSLESAQPARQAEPVQYASSHLRGSAPSL